MDYSYYATTQTPYQLLGFTPDSNRTQQNPQSNSFNSIPPPTNPHFDAPFKSFDLNVYDTNNFVHPHYQNQRHSVHQSPAPSVSPSSSQRNDAHQASLSEPNITSNNDVVGQNTTSDLTGDDFINRNRSSSEEKDSMTPAQSKRKAQNRAAQRAFRERKERHVKELEAKLNDLKDAFTSLHDENERLKRELAKVATENEILRATSSSGPPMQSNRGVSRSSRQDDEMMRTGPMKYTPTDFLTAIRMNHADENETTNFTLDTLTIPAPLISSQGSFTPSAHRITISPLTGQRLLSAGATWDYIQANPLFKEGLVDIAAVSERLKGLAECDGTGPAFEEGTVTRAIEESAGFGSDELI